MSRSAPIALVLAGLVSWFSMELRPQKWSVPEASGYVPLPPSTEFTTAIELEKTRFLRGEQILVWLVTELGSGEKRAIPVEKL